MFPLPLRTYINPTASLLSSTISIISPLSSSSYLPYLYYHFLLFLLSPSSVPSYLFCSSSPSLFSLVPIFYSILLILFFSLSFTCPQLLSHLLCSFPTYFLYLLPYFPSSFTPYLLSVTPFLFSLTPFSVSFLPSLPLST